MDKVNSLRIIFTVTLLSYQAHCQGFGSTRHYECGVLTLSDTTTTGGTVVSVSSRLACINHCTTYAYCGAVTWHSSTCTAYTNPLSKFAQSGSTVLEVTCACPTSTVGPTGVTTIAAKTTAAPTTAAPTTAAPTTADPSTAAPTTAAPTTAAPTTAAPTTAAPTTAAPTTAAPTTATPSTAAPTTAVPTTAAPTTATPSTTAPTTAAPSTAAPTTAAPTTAAPTTAAPTTAAPTTAAPSTAAPTTAAPTTLAPTTAARTTSPTNAAQTTSHNGKAVSTKESTTALDLGPSQSLECGWIPTVSSTAQGGTTVSSVTSRLQCLNYCKSFGSCGGAAWTQGSSTCKVFKNPVTKSTESGTVLFMASCDCAPTTVTITVPITTEMTSIAPKCPGYQMTQSMSLSDTPSTTVALTNVNDCLDRCTSSASCMAATWNNGSSQCSLFDTRITKVAAAADVYLFAANQCACAVVPMTTG